MRKMKSKFRVSSFGCRTKTGETPLLMSKVYDLHWRPVRLCSKAAFARRPSPQWLR